MKELKSLGKLLWKNAEPGFFENNTHKILSNKFSSMGFHIQTFENIPGFIATIDANYKSKPIALISDMDALPLPGDPENRYIHSCGHHVQMTALYGTAHLLKKNNPELLKYVAFIAIPAEEYIDFEKRNLLIDAKQISVMSGKLELITRGFFDSPKFVISTHSAAFKSKLYISSVLNMSGFTVMNFSFIGKASHAGAAPHLGLNAQNAASLFLQACAFLRESFKEQKHIRIHPILKLDSNQSVNLIPEHVTVETYVRAADLESVNKVVKQLEKASKGCASAIGAKVEVSILDGYQPFKADLPLHKLIKETAKNMNIEFIEEQYSSASSDVGNISQMKPTVMLGLPGANGKFHNPDFRITDEEAAYIFPSEFLVKYIRMVADSTCI
ncbi:MAG: amidohydrolase [Spirochaetia bacterium]|jgi:amidohydrolase|nr:amidohydrolase [Spirochaetia bacterium]